MMREGRLSVLIMEDEADIRERLRTMLSSMRGSLMPGPLITEASEVSGGIEAIDHGHLDFVIVDTGLLEVDDGQVQLQVRDMSTSTPVLMLDRLHIQTTEFAGVNDDCPPIPFTRNQLIIRMQGVHRRWQPPATEFGTTFEDGRLHLDFTREQVIFDGKPIDLTRLQYRLLATLVRHRGQVLGSAHVVELAGDGPLGRDAEGKEEFLRPRRLGLSDPNPDGRLDRRLVKGDLLYLLDELLGWGWNNQDSPIEVVRGFGFRYS